MIIGIDPGLTGAVAFVWDGLYLVLDIPTMANGKGSSKVKQQVNASALKSMILRNIEDDDGHIGPCSVFMERVSSMPGQGVASMFSMGDTFGCIRGVCAAMGLPVEIVTPQSWKKHYHLGSDKEVIRAKAIELFPLAELGRKKDHNRAEALLIARYGAELNNRAEEA